MSTLLNYTNFGITLEIQKIMATFLDNIVVKTSFILMPTFSTTAQYRTRVTVETFDTMLVIFHRKILKKVGISINDVFNTKLSKNVAIIF